MGKLTANGQTFEGLDNQKIKYTKQIADIFDLAVVSSSYTDGFKIPKTPLNTQIMQGLGIIGDTSQIPYQKVPSTLSTKDGFTLFTNGWLFVKETSDDYSVSCIDGMIDFFKAIENKTMGADLDLSNFSHIKDLPSVIASFSNIYYKYIVADYNGKNIGVNGVIEGINIDYLVPCFNMMKLFELVMSTFGYSFINTNITEISDLWITYPKNPAETIIDTLSASLNKTGFVSLPTDVGGGYYSALPTYKTWTSYVINEGSLQGLRRYRVGVSSPYRIEVETEMYALYKKNGFFDQTELIKPMEVSVNVNGTSIISFLSDAFNSVSGNVTLYLNVGDIVEFDYKVTPFSIPINPTGGSAYILREIRHNNTDLKIYRTNQGNVNLSDAFKDYSIKDFIKEVFWRTSVTPIIDTFTKTMSFVSLDERLDFRRSIDWSDKYVERTNESYLQNGYAQKNSFSHRYNDENDVSQNGFLYVNNQNLDDFRTLIQSRIYAPELILYTFTDGTQTNKFAIWSRETKEDADGNIGIEYKGLNQRFFIVKILNKDLGSYDFVSEAVPGVVTVTQYPYADTTGTTYDQIVPNKYSKYNSVLNNFRLHNIKLALTENDILGLDLTRPYYIKKEASYYLLNRIVYEEGEKSIGEFIRINK